MKHMSVSRGYFGRMRTLVTEDDPAPVSDWCPAAVELARRGMRFGLAPGTVSLLAVRHDAWCPRVGGDGHQPCRPEYWFQGRNVTPAAILRRPDA